MTGLPADLPTDLPILPFADGDAWETWLVANAASKGLWLKIAKKDSGIATVTYDQALEVALCHGWIDGQKRGFDGQYFLQRFTPRRPKGLWSKINIGKVERLIAEGRMRAGGQREVDAAKADGRWDAAYAGQATMAVPEDLDAALAADETARTAFETLNAQNRYAILHRITTATSAASRSSRLERMVAMLGRGETPYP